MTSAQVNPPKPAGPAVIGEERYVMNRVLAQLGRPANLYRINAEKLWGSQFRVNVYCAEESDRPVKRVTMTDSFFVTLVGDEISSVPPIARRY